MQLTFIGVISWSSVVCCSVHSDGGSGGGRPAGRLDGGEGRQEAQSDVLLAAVHLWFYHHHRCAERVDVLHRQSAHRPRQWSHVTGRPGKKHCLFQFRLEKKNNCLARSCFTLSSSSRKLDLSLLPVLGYRCSYCVFLPGDHKHDHKYTREK